MLLYIFIYLALLKNNTRSMRHPVRIKLTSNGQKAQSTKQTKNNIFIEPY